MLVQAVRLVLSGRLRYTGGDIELKAASVIDIAAGVNANNDKNSSSSSTSGNSGNSGDTGTAVESVVIVNSAKSQLLAGTGGGKVITSHQSR